MKHNYFLIAISACVILLASCSYHIRKQNNENLKKLHIGMTKQEVLDIMGEPLKNEVYNTDNVWYYFTQVKWSDGSITRDECTPLFFENGKLAGWGRTEYKKYRQKEW
jgi:outer membrane protein assembly factor BamE (lipoprotein component of BamABCDE complex)